MMLSMGTRYAILIALTIVSKVAVATDQFNEVGSIDIVNRAEGDIRASCIALAAHTSSWSLGEFSIRSGCTWEAKVGEPATSIYCTFSLSGILEKELSMWETNDFLYDLPVVCKDCHWGVDEKGFFLLNHYGQYIQVADWVST